MLVLRGQVRWEMQVVVARPVISSPIDVPEFKRPLEHQTSTRFFNLRGRASSMHDAAFLRGFQSKKRRAFRIIEFQ